MLELRALGGLALHGAGPTQPKRLALLCYLTLAGSRGFHRRDSLVALFWPELDEAHARQSLRQALTAIRALDDRLVVTQGDEEVGIASGVLSCDVLDFQQALEQGEPVTAVERYTGPFLNGFFLNDCPEFERWVESERARLSGLAAHAAWKLADEEQAPAAVQWARRAAALQPDDEGALRRLVTVLDRAGDRAGALREYEAFARRLREQYQAEPAPETQALMAAVRARRERSATSPAEEVLRSGTTPGNVPPRRRGWRIFAGVTALVFLSAAGWLGPRLLRRSPPSAANWAHRPFTIVADLDGNAPAEVRDAARNLIISALDESGALASLPTDQIGLGLTLAGKAETTRLDVATARELAVRGAVRTLVTGTVDQVGQTYHTAVRVLDADSEVVVAARSAVARGDDDLIPTLDRLVRALRADLGERQAAIAANRPLEVVATPSFAAYQLYRRARELDYDGQLPAAIAAYKDALAVDRDFAMAWRGLGATYGQRGFPDSSLSALNEALARPQRLTAAQRLDAEGLRAFFGTGDDAAALAAWERAHRLYDGEPHNLGAALSNFGRQSEAVALYEEWERSAPFGLNNLSQFNLIYALLPLGRVDEARRRAESLSGNWGHQARLEVAVWTADWPAVDSFVTKYPSPRARASVAAARGRVREALGILGDCCRLEQLVLRTVSGSPVTGAQLGAAPRREGGPLLAALWAAAAGDTGAARRILTRVRSLPPEERARLDAAAVLVEAWLAGAAGRPAEVVRLLRPLAERGTPAGPPLTQPLRWSLADAYEHQGLLDSTAVQLERLAAWQGAWENDRLVRGLTHSFAHQRLVMLYARLGRPDDARRHWRVFSETFTNPDPELRYLVDEAHAAVASTERRK